MSKSLEPITIIASEFCQDIGDSTEFHHERFSKKLLRGYKKIFTFLSPELDVQTEIFPSDGQIKLPCDFVYETKVGLRKNGITVILDLNRNLKFEKRILRDSQIQNEINGFFDGSLPITRGYSFFNAMHNGNYLGELYGAGCGYHANTWYNIEDGILNIGSLIDQDTEVVVEYKSNGLKDGFKLIPSEMVESVIYKGKELFYEDSKPGLAATMAEKHKVEYQRLKRLYSHRDVDYLAWLFKSSDRPAHY